MIRKINKEKKVDQDQYGCLTNKSLQVIPLRMGYRTTEDFLVQSEAIKRKMFRIKVEI